jgi:thioredoxin-related protein
MKRATLAFAVSIFGSQVKASGYGLPKAQNLQSALQKARAQSMPLVVMVTIDGCPYCKVVRQNYLPEYLEKGFPILDLDLASSAPMQNEFGQSTTPREWARSKGGQEVVSRLVGMSSSDFYGAYLDERMQQAHQQMKSGH